MPLHFRSATLADAPALAALVNSAYRGDSSRAGWTTEADLLGGQRTDAAKLADVIARGDSCVRLAFTASLTACVHIEKILRASEPDAALGAYVGMMTVAPTAQASGIGRQLLAHAEAFARDEWGARFAEMTVISARHELIDWYVRRGYARTGEHRAFPADDPRFGIPKVPLEFIVLRKSL